MKCSLAIKKLLFLSLFAFVGAASAQEFPDCDAEGIDPCAGQAGNAAPTMLTPDGRCQINFLGGPSCIVDVPDGAGDNTFSQCLACVAMCGSIDINELTSLAGICEVAASGDDNNLCSGKSCAKIGGDEMLQLID